MMGTHEPGQCPTGQGQSLSEPALLEVRHAGPSLRIGRPLDLLPTFTVLTGEWRTATGLQCFVLLIASFISVGLCV